MKIIVAHGCRSDTALITPIVNRLKKDPMIDCEILNLVPANYSKSFELASNLDCDLIIVPGDRIEIAACATSAFLQNIPICQIYGGVTNYPLSTFDDILRHQISLMSDIVFVENLSAMVILYRLFNFIGKNIDDIINVGNIYMCEYETDNELILDEPYDLILYNSYKGDNWEKNIGKIKVLVEKSKHVVIIGGNPDKKIETNIGGTYYDNVSRSCFLGLLQNCERFITNSSSAYYEAPTFLKPEQIILIGDRNKARSSINLLKGDPDLVIETIKAWWRDRQ